ncbi:MAG: hypothetical protein IPM98_02665 [Lewinellaceae bacterium]|nr:hypothetical protein [Lewinellaceae bacterium]
MAGLRLERRIGGTPFSDQSNLERAIRMAAGMFVMMAPYFLVFALIYWLLYRFNRPASPRLNLLHFALSTIGLGSFLLYAGYSELTQTTFFLAGSNDNDWVTGLLMGIYTLGQLVFLVNIGAALMKKRIDW